MPRFIGGLELTANRANPKMTTLVSDKHEEAHRFMILCKDEQRRVALL